MNHMPDHPDVAAAHEMTAAANARAGNHEFCRKLETSIARAENVSDAEINAFLAEWRKTNPKVHPDKFFASRLIAAVKQVSAPSAPEKAAGVEARTIALAAAGQVHDNEDARWVETLVEMLVASTLSAFQSRNAELEAQIEEARDILSEISSYVGAGLGDDGTPLTDYAKRIRWGIDHLCGVASKIGGVA